MILWHWGKLPGTLYKNLCGVTRKINPIGWRFFAEQHSKPVYFGEMYESIPRWLPVFLYVDDVYLRNKMWGAVYDTPPQVSLTFFGRWTIGWRQDSGKWAFRYWEVCRNVLTFRYLLPNTPIEELEPEILQKYHSYGLDDYIKEGA